MPRQDCDCERLGLLIVAAAVWSMLLAAGWLFWGCGHV